MSKHVQVLLSSFNGLDWIAEQLKSIQSQTYPNVSILIRDDGSTDTTVAFLTEYKNKNRNCTICIGENIGIYKSFMALLKLADEHADYFAFSDQDDFWLPDKIQRAVEQLDKISDDTPALYYTRFQFVNEQLQNLGYSAIPTQSGFHTALVQNQANGCTIVINKAARRLILQSVPEWALMHDWWFFLVVSAFGKIIYDPKPTILYRQHSRNVTLSSPIFIIDLFKRFRRILGESKNEKMVTDQAKEFFDRYGHMLDDQKKQIICGILHARKSGLVRRFFYALTMPVRRNTPFDTLIMRILIIIGRF